MTRQPAIRRLHQGLALALVVALAPLAHAAAPPPLPVAPGPGPLFDPREFHTNPVHMALAVVAASSTRHGPFAAVAVLEAGERTKTWSLDGVLTFRHSRVSLGAATLVLSGLGGGPFAELATLALGHDLDCWALQDTDLFRPLPPEWLEGVTDGRGIPVGGLEAETYSRVLTRANYTSPKAFQKAARKDVTYSHVYEDPERYRGVVVHVEGRLMRVNRYAPPFEAADAGVNDIYEAWVFNEQVGANPYCVIFTSWPAGLSRDLLGAKVDPYIRVAIDGYFFKKFRYKSKDSRGSERDAPLVIGNGLVLLSSGMIDRSASATTWMNKLVWLFAGVMFALILGVVSLTYWYRRSDNRVRRRIMARMPEFALPPPDAPPLAVPVAPVARPVGERPAVSPPRITFPAGRGHRGEAGREQGGGNGKREKPPDEGAGA